MKFLKYTASAVIAMAALASCSTDEPALPKGDGMPVMDIKTQISTANFGDNIKFVVNCSDSKVPLSTLKATLYFGDEAVSQTTIRTKDNGADYEGEINVPYIAHIPDGNATLVFTLQNIHFTITEQEIAVPVSHADYPYLTLVSETEEATTEYRLNRVDKYCYEITDRLPQKVKGFIHTPVVGENGTEVIFGYKGNEVVVNGENAIPFSNPTSGTYTISFNSFTFAAAPFVSFKIDGEELDGIDDTSAGVDLSLTKGQVLRVDVPDFDNWWVDPDYFDRNDDGSLTFLPNGGDYRLIACTDLEYLRVYKVSGGQPATMTATGLGTLWVMGDGIGKPSVALNEVGWDGTRSLCAPSFATKVYEVTFIAGETIATDGFKIRFCGAIDGSDALTVKTVNSDLVKSATDGTITLADGVTLTEGVCYKAVIDITKGKRAIVLTFSEAAQ